MRKIRISNDGAVKRRFHADVRKLKKNCEENNFHLVTIDEASAYYICVLSDTDYEIGDEASMCSEENENYFLSPTEYEQFCELYLN